MQINANLGGRQAEMGGYTAFGAHAKCFSESDNGCDAS